ncbi:retrovirus-related pol polyprotein from transposon RE1 [Citrus sinensis]|nr:retrovirus-related pol polyprotein from transposon RE1 [Citrus sinensis]
MTSINLASSSNQIQNTSAASTTISFTFNTPVKLDQANYLIWRSQVLASICGNRLEKLIDDSVTPPPTHIAQRVGDDIRSVENSDFISWRSQDQVLLGWLLSSMSKGIISLVFNLETSREVWKAIEVQFGSQSKSRLLHLRYMLNSTRKDDMKITDYFIKVKNISDNMAAAGSALSNDDLILHILSGLGPDYNSVATYITGQVGTGKMDLNEAFAMLLTREARIEGPKKGNMFNRKGFGGYGYNSGSGNNHNSSFGNNGHYKGNFGTEFAGVGFNNQFNGYQSGNQRRGGNWNNNNGSNNFNNGKPSMNPKPQWNASKPTCQICLRPGHTANICWKLEEFMASGAYRPPLNRGPKAAYLTNMDAPVDNNWYLDSGATHHLTNDMNNVNVVEPFSGNSKLVVGNGFGLSITHIGSTILRMHNALNYFELKLNNILLVPKITKNLISISKLTKDNDVVIEFTDNFCFVKDKVKNLVILQGKAEKVPNSNLKPFEAIAADTGSNTSSSHYNILLPAFSTHPISSTNTITSHIIPTTSPVATSNTISSPFIHQNSPELPIPFQASLHTSPSKPSLSLSNPTISVHPMTTRAKAGIFKPKAFLTAHNSLEPSNVGEALADLKWKDAMQLEYDALIRNKTWNLVSMDLTHKLVGCKWVFRTKYNSDGSVSKHKARLVAKGFHQTAGVDYSETYSPVVKSSTVRVILSLAVMQGWNVRQIDINNAFLNRDLTEDVYMQQQEGFVSKGGYICKLNKALYGLKQAPRAWYDKLKGCLTYWNFTNSKADTSLFIKHDTKGIILILIYVDDILVTGPDSVLLEAFITKLSKAFALKDLGLVSYFLGIEVSYTDHGMHLSQTKYIKDLLTKTSMQNCKETETPFSTGYKLERIAKGSLGAEFENPTLYRSLVGGLQYLVLTRPDIAYSVHKLSQCLIAPTLQHWLACKKVLRYLQATITYGLYIQQEGTLETKGLTGYSDADWACDTDDRKSIGAYCIFLGDLAKNPVFHSKTKHIELDVHYIRDKVLNKELEVRYIPTEEQVADVLTKPLSFPKFSYFRSKLNVVNKPLSLRGDVKEAHVSQIVSKAEDCNSCSSRLQVDDLAC